MPEKNRYAALYQDRFLDLLPAVTTDELSEEQLKVLSEMNLVVSGLTNLYLKDFMRYAHTQEPRISPVPADWNADRLAFNICSVFRNRFNSSGDRYELDYAKSGILRYHLLCLRARDSADAANLPPEPTLPEDWDEALTMAYLRVQRIRKLDGLRPGDEECPPVQYILSYDFGPPVFEREDVIDYVKEFLDKLAREKNDPEEET